MKKKEPINSPVVVNKLVTENHKLAYYFARRYNRWWKSINPHSFFETEGGFDSDMLSLCLYALFQAAQSYDPEKAKFSTWVNWYVVKELHIIIKSKQRKKAIPNEMVFSQIDAMIQKEEGFLSFQDTLKDEKYDIDQEVEDRMVLHGIDNVYQTLLQKNKRWAYIFKLKSEGKTLREMGKELGISYERVRQILNKVEDYLLELPLNLFKKAS